MGLQAVIKIQGAKDTLLIREGFLSLPKTVSTGRNFQENLRLGMLE